MTKSHLGKRDRKPIDRCHLYGIRSPHALAIRLGWDLEKLRKLAENGGYSVYPHAKTGRMIQEPGRALQSLHRQFHNYLARIEVPDYLHSAVRGRSYLTNARAHIGDRSLIKIDVAKFYQSVPQYKVMHFFRDVMKCSGDVAGLLANLICFNKKLATGSAVSPIISYYTYKGMFDGLDELAKSYGLVMSCYVDDITMSGQNANSEVLHEARTIIFQNGLRAHKDRRFSPDFAKTVTGIIVRNDGISLPFCRWQKIKQHEKTVIACENLNEKCDLLRKLVSRLYEAAQIEPQCRAKAEFYHRERLQLERRLLGVKDTSVPAEQAA